MLTDFLLRVAEAMRWWLVALLSFVAAVVIEFGGTTWGWNLKYVAATFLAGAFCAAVTLLRFRLLCTGFYDEAEDFYPPFVWFAVIVLALLLLVARIHSWSPHVFSPVFIFLGELLVGTGMAAALPAIDTLAYSLRYRRQRKQLA